MMNKNVKIARELVRLARCLTAAEEEVDDETRQRLDESEEAGKKYILYKKEGGLWRIMACRDFADLNKGDFGGLIESEDNLSHGENCWVYDNGRIYGNAKVFGNAVVWDDAAIYGNAKVYDGAEVYGNAKIYDDAEVFDEASVFDKATVCGNSCVYGNARVSGNSVIFNETVNGYKTWSNQPS